MKLGLSLCALNMTVALYVPVSMSTSTSVLPKVGRGCLQLLQAKVFRVSEDAKAVTFVSFHTKDGRPLIGIIVTEAPVSISAKVLTPSTATGISPQPG